MSSMAWLSYFLNFILPLLSSHIDSNVGFYLVADGTALIQKYAEYRIVKHIHVCVKGRKHIPQEDLLTNMSKGLHFV